MKNKSLESLLPFLLFSITLIATALCSGIEKDSFGDDLIPSGLNLLLLFILIYSITYFSLKSLSKKYGKSAVIGPILFVLISFILINLLTVSFKFTLKSLPFYLSWILGFYGGLTQYQSGFKIIRVILLVAFPLLMSFGLHEKWVHKIEFGNFNGTIDSPKVIAFDFSNKSKLTISNDDLKGKVVLLDFWFIGCPPCWKKFPILQSIYEKYKGNSSFALFAVNRSDNPNRVFTRIEDKGYTFPVLLSTQKAMDDFGVYVYPSVVLLNKKGEVVFMGELEEAELLLEKLLNE
jgi:thiol-disulfide isomerase/thioredoxin